MHPTLFEGALYSTEDGDGTYTIIKILKVDEVGVHVRQVGQQWRSLRRLWGGIYQTGRQPKVVSSVNAHAFESAVQAEPPSLCTRDPFRANRTPNGLRWPSVPLRWRAANPCAPLRPS